MTRLSQLKYFFSSLVIAPITLIGALAPSAQAYIPHSHTIVGRLVRNNGKGVYIVDQEVQFRTAGEPLVLREHWVIENGETMRLSVSSPPSSKAGAESAHLDASYRDGKRFGPDLMAPTSAAAGTTKVTALPTEFLETFFHARSSSGFLTALHRSHIVPPSALHARTAFTKLEQVKYVPEPYVRLGRTAGVVTWIFGDPTPVQANKLSPAAWVEQDSFVLRRLRFPTEAEVSADRFTAYPNALHLPRERTVTWANNSVLIRILSVKHMAQAPTRDASPTKSTNLPDIAQVKEFYSRFR